ncbi:glycosyltransferase family 9 protein [Desulfonatronovibrio hydrogenovorans]|uniref:glycosyltransferase family 9 protein n=1 Tax=Desulfonatronovibrio hydrogenovorans TaxID=53245 RepID=UPI0004901062|nr:glycosyltransferase family 9 protein [Desulfonatronovibrio hydrogenovorans]
MPFNKIGVWQTAFLGDAVLTLPLLQTLNNACPQARLFFFVRKGLGRLFEPDTRFQTIEFDKYGADQGLSGLFRTARKIRKMDLDLWISPHASFRSAMIAVLSRIKARIGYSSPWPNVFAYPTRVDRRFTRLDEIERVLELLRPLKPDSIQTWPDLVLDKSSMNKAEQFWSSNISGRTLGIHPGSTWPTKQWPEAHFARIVDLTSTLPGVRVLIFAGPGEEKVVQNILNLSRKKDHVLNLAGRLNLPDLAAYIDRLDCYLTNDSGPMHLAWTRKTPVIALFGPTTRELGFFPRGKDSVVLESGLPCRPCGLHGHRHCPEGHHRCMLDITPETVMKYIKEMIHG